MRLPHSERLLRKAKKRAGDVCPTLPEIAFRITFQKRSAGQLCLRLGYFLVEDIPLEVCQKVAEIDKRITCRSFIEIEDLDLAILRHDRLRGIKIAVDRGDACCVIIDRL